MRVLFGMLDGSVDTFSLQQVTKLSKKRRVVLIKQLLCFEVFIRRDHYVIQVAVGDLQVVTVADVAFCCNLRTHRHIRHSRELTLLHKAELMRMVICPFQSPAFLLLELQNTASLTVNF